MAKVTGPLMSLGARGQIAKTLVMSVWKGIKTARQYVVPANPNTTAQAAQRVTFRTASQAYATSVLTEELKAAWNRAAALASSAISGANLCVRNLCLLIDSESVVPLVASVTLDGTDILVEFASVKGSAAIAQVTVFTGTTANKLSLLGTYTAVGGVVTIAAADLGAYFDVRSAQKSISGIYKTADAPPA